VDFCSTTRSSGDQSWKRLTASVGSEPDGRVHLSSSRLQHLLYLAQGWSLANRYRQLFYEEIEAWEYGPVVRAVYARYRSVPEGTVPPRWQGRFVTEEEKEWVRATWEAYRGYTATQLIELVHSQAPWQAAYRPKRDGEVPERCVISQDAMREYFSRLPLDF
jgi:uncharacterized phage-associated protein